MKGQRFGYPLWQHILQSLDTNKNVYRNCRKMNIGYNLEMFKEMEKLGWLKITKNGRENKIELTKKGSELRDTCINLKYLKEKIQK